jgi:hypothetical protein
MMKIATIAALLGSASAFAPVAPSGKVRLLERECLLVGLILSCRWMNGRSKRTSAREVATDTDSHRKSSRKISLRDAWNTLFVVVVVVVVVVSAQFVMSILVQEVKGTTFSWNDIGRLLPCTSVSIWGDLGDDHSKY